jgi:hypothetical protein
MRENVPMERASKHQIVIACELAHARVEFAIVYETAGLADDEERKDDPGEGQQVVLT